MNWCAAHPKYSAKRQPNSLCGDCWRLWFLRCPELRHDARRVLSEPNYPVDYAELDVSAG